MSNVSYQTTNDGQYIWPVDGSYHASEEALKAHAEPMIAKLEKLAGHPLTERHLLLSPVRHEDDRSLRQKIADEGKMTVREKEPKPLNPYQYAIDEKKRANMTRDEAMAVRAAEWEAKQAAKEQARADKAALENPEYRRATQHARTELLYLRFDPSVGIVAIKEGEKRLAIAESGNLEEYARLDDEFRKEKAAKLMSSVAEIDQQISALRDQKAAIENAAFNVASPTLEELPEGYFRKDGKLYRILT